MTSSPLSMEDLRLLAQLVKDFDLSDLELVRENGEKLRMRRGSVSPGDQQPLASGGEQQRAALPAAVHGPPDGLAATPLPQAAEDEAHVTYITSPFVGTFYRSSSQDAQPFVEPGQRVRRGQTLCIIEAMKLMNELEAEIDGVVLACLADNGRPVEYGERLFRVRPGPA